MVGEYCGAKDSTQRHVEDVTELRLREDRDGLSPVTGLRSSTPETRTRLFEDRGFIGLDHEVTMDSSGDSMGTYVLLTGSVEQDPEDAVPVDLIWSSGRHNG